MYLITKEKSKAAYAGKFKNDMKSFFYQNEGSINDDLEFFHKNLHTGKPIETEDVDCFLLPKLTKNELKLVEEDNEGDAAMGCSHIKTF